jgi:hypothetical protein
LYYLLKGDIMANGNGNGKTLVPFMGGSVVIKEGGSFKDLTGKQVDYDPCVDMSAIVDIKGRVSPLVFRNMIDAVSKHPSAMKAVEALV